MEPFGLLLRMLPVFGATLLCFGMGLFWAITRVNNPAFPPPLGDPIAFIFMAVLGMGATITLSNQERRIRELEKQLRDREGHD